MQPGPAAAGPERPSRTGSMSGPLHLDDDALVACVSCGLCLPHCPTYRVSGREIASPRGRITAMRAVEWHDAPIDGAFRATMEECVSCRGCEAACPSGVPFGKLMEQTRAAMPPTPSRARRLAEWFAYTLVLPRHWLLLALTWVLWLGQRLRLVPKRLGLPRVSLRRWDVPGGGTPDAWLFTGCVMDAWQRDTHRAAAPRHACDRRRDRAARYGRRLLRRAACARRTRSTGAGVGTARDRVDAGHRAGRRRQCGVRRGDEGVRGAARHRRSSTFQRAGARLLRMVSRRRPTTHPPAASARRRTGPVSPAARAKGPRRGARASSAPRTSSPRPTTTGCVAAPAARTVPCNRRSRVRSATERSRHCGGRWGRGTRSWLRPTRAA